MPDVHSKFSPSSAHRWLACPASLEGPPVEDRSSEYAAEGTVAHALAQQCWLTGAPPEMFIGQKRSCDGHTIEINEEMAGAVQMYLDFVESQADGQQVLTETRIEHSTIKNFGGTLDCMIPAKRHLIDFKYGAGIAVDVMSSGEKGSWYEFNAQMACYALLFCEHNGRESSDVTISIVQPRASHPEGPIRTAVVNEEFLWEFLVNVMDVANGKRAGELHAGDHCRWCPRAANCPELYELTLKTARSEFADDEMTPERAAEVLALQTAVKVYIDAVEQWVHGQLDKGQSVPGYKLVERFGQRRYAADEAAIVRRCRNAKFGKKQIYRSELLSPAQLEKVVGKELITSLVERPHLGTTVVPESDRRKAVTRVTAAEEFESVSLENLES